METSYNLQSTANNLETALTGLTKLIKALSFYPANHPSLVAVANETYSDFQKFLENQEADACLVTQDGFNLRKIPLAPNNSSLENLAIKLVERRVRQLLFLPELSSHELLMFAEEIARPANDILSEGGVGKRLAARQIRSIWINEPNVKTIQDKQNRAQKTPAERQRTRVQSNPAAKPENPQQTVIEQMREQLEQLKEPQEDESYLALLENIQQLSHPFFNKTGITGYLAVLNLLNAQCKDSTRHTAQQQAASASLDHLLSEATTKRLVDAVAEPDLKAAQRRALGRLLVGLGTRIAPQLLERLYAERDAIIRRHYSAILAHMGESIFDLLKKDLHHEIWHRVRNVVTVLGETRLEAALPLLSQVIDYPEARVRRAVIQSLVAIGGNSVIPLLLRLTQDIDEELHHPAIMALGTLRNARAIPPLVDILNRTDPFGKKTALKTEVIHALATTRSPQAIIPLLKLARRLNLPNRKNIEILRAEAILALGQLGNSKLIPVLKQLPKVEKEPVSRALQQATSQLRKRQHVV